MYDPPPPGGLQLSKEVLVANRPDPRVEERKKERKTWRVITTPGPGKRVLLGDLIFFPLCIESIDIGD